MYWNESRNAISSFLSSRRFFLYFLTALRFPSGINRRRSADPPGNRGRCPRNVPIDPPTISFTNFFVESEVPGRRVWWEHAGLPRQIANLDVAEFQNEKRCPQRKRVRLCHRGDCNSGIYRPLRPFNQNHFPAISPREQCAPVCQDEAAEFHALAPQRHHSFCILRAKLPGRVGGPEIRRRITETRWGRQRELTGIGKCPELFFFFATAASAGKEGMA